MMLLLLPDGTGQKGAIMKSVDLEIAQAYLLRFIGEPEGWDMRHVNMEIEGTEEDPRLIYLISYDAAADGFECNAKMLDTFNEHIADEAHIQGWGINGIPYLFTEIRQEKGFIRLVAMYCVFAG